MPWHVNWVKKNCSNKWFNRIFNNHFMRRGIDFRFWIEYLYNSQSVYPRRAYQCWRSGIVRSLRQLGTVQNHAFTMEKAKVSIISRIVVDLHPPKPENYFLVIEIDFPSSLVDLSCQELWLFKETPLREDKNINIWLKDLSDKHVYSENKTRGGRRI